MTNKRTVPSASFTDAISPRNARNATDPDLGGHSEPGGAGGADDVEPLDTAIERVLAEIGGDTDASINVYAIRPGSRGGEFVDSFPVDAFAGEASFLKRIRDEFGAGEFRIQLRHGRTFRVNRIVRIAPARERAPRDEPGAAVAAALARLDEQFRRSEQLVREAITARPQQPESEEAFLRRLQLYREVLGGGAGASAARSGAESIEVFLQGLNLGRSLEPSTGAGTTDVLLETVKTLGPALVRAVQLGDRPALPAQPARPAPPAKPAPAAPGAPGDDPAMSAAVRKLLEQLIDAAERDADPDLYAELTLDQVGPDAVQQLFAAGDPVILLGNLDPRVLEHRDWFTALQASLQELLADETPNPINGAAAGTGGSDLDTPTHARDDT